MKIKNFPNKIRGLTPHQCRFEATKLDADNSTVYFASYPAGAKTEPHTHDTDNWGVITAGQMKMMISGEEFIYDVGDWYYIPAHAEHAAYCDEPTEMIEFWFNKDEEAA